MDNTINDKSPNASPLSRSETTTDTVTISDAGLSAERKLQQMAHKYDPTNMSYSELTRMSSELQLNGLITSQEGLAMRAPPSRDFDPDEKYDTVALARKSVAFDQSLSAAQSKDATLRTSVLDILETLQGR
ncbi:hypothetical protein GPLA_3624 [Paraglaciecola polaris LMG 21857]|uniref:Uncharacterized protein n=3 Tax=Paraglaciecola polaris TaxID=222814 RepID=K6ZW86_9ALTE|nr:hypothetical protein GPLA_3624 [Paraglaciecola polaris LMG 21857]|tara:strand:- start:1837 stop:2229 length:393 start_codon:yes stop_codon:yes gene_type:complete